MVRANKRQYCGTCGAWGGRLTHRCRLISSGDWIDMFDHDGTVNVRCASCGQFSSATLYNVSGGGVRFKCDHCRSLNAGRLDRWPSSRLPTHIPTRPMKPSHPGDTYGT